MSSTTDSKPRSPAPRGAAERDRPGARAPLALLNPSGRAARWALKAAVLLTGVLLALYPNPALLAVNAQRWMNLDALPDGDSPLLAPLEAELRAALPAPADGATADDLEALRAVEKLVWARLPYAWDWDVWGAVDYIPTVHEALRAGREDCDGQAVVAAALLRRLGHPARVVGDGGHFWVQTSRGTCMGATGAALLAPDGSGATGVNLWAALSARELLIGWPSKLVYGVRVFPLSREIALAALVWLCLLGASPRWRPALLALGVLVAALLLVRALVPTHISGWHDARLAGAAWGIALPAITGFVLLMRRAGALRRRAGSTDAPLRARAGTPEAVAPDQPATGLAPPR